MNETWHYIERTSGLTVSISPLVLNLFNSSRQRLWQRERGGVLFAQSVGTSGHIEISDASGPHPSDHSGWNWLQLDNRRCVDEIYSRFTEGLHFVGYWHTHPERRPQLSGDDLTAFRHNGGIALRRMIAVIVGTDHSAAGLCIAIVSDDDSSPSLLTHSPENG